MGKWCKVSLTFDVYVQTENENEARDIAETEIQAALEELTECNESGIYCYGKIHINKVETEDI